MLILAPRLQEEVDSYQPQEWEATAQLAQVRLFGFSFQKLVRDFSVVGDLHHTVEPFLKIPLK